MEEALPSELIFAIYKFLTENDLKKTAKALRKEVSLDLNQNADVDLMAVYRKYLKKKRESLHSSNTEIIQNEDPELTENLTADPTPNQILDATKNGTGHEVETKKKRKRKNKSDVNMIVDMEIPENIANADQGYTGFRRVTTDLSEINPMLRDNSFAKKVKMGGNDKQWGMKACNDFKNTSGKSFRHEKTKKKRGSYRGGSIGTEVCSFKFDVSDDSD